MLGQVVVSGLAMGAIYALVALGYAFVWKTMNIVNFAAGEFLTFGAFVFVATFVTRMRTLIERFDFNHYLAILRTFKAHDQ